MGRRGQVFHVRGRPICSSTGREFRARIGRNYRFRVEIVWTGGAASRVDADNIKTRV